MRVSREQASRNRQKIVSAASRMFRERGIAATGVDAITSDAGLTHGAMYSQFESKEAITAEAVSSALAQSERLWRRLIERDGPARAFAAIVEQYLSKDHRDSAGRGCVVAALGSEIARQSPSVRDAFTTELKKALKFISRVTPARDTSRAYDDAIAAFVSMAGALILARAVSDRTLSNRILKSTAERVIRRSRSKRESSR
ncbi:MAG TPA: TetR family transcriptional regulator [Candidatus Acidoferrales bacterium]|nr:TetR family transcriptional regulator [Candidatus Acidoferrales bacterium]